MCGYHHKLKFVNFYILYFPSTYNTVRYGNLGGVRLTLHRVFFYLSHVRIERVAFGLQKASRLNRIE